MKLQPHRTLVLHKQTLRVLLRVELRAAIGGVNETAGDHAQPLSCVATCPGNQTGHFPQ